MRLQTLAAFIADECERLDSVEHRKSVARFWTDEHRDEILGQCRDILAHIEGLYFPPEISIDRERTAALRGKRLKLRMRGEVLDVTASPTLNGIRVHVAGSNPHHARDVVERSWNHFGRTINAALSAVVDIDAIIREALGMPAEVTK